MPADADGFIIRRIITGLIVSTEYAREIERVWNPQFIGEHTAQMIATWCFDHLHKYGEAPGSEIQSIYIDKLKAGLTKEQAEDIEDILDGLSHEHDQGKMNIGLLLTQTKKFFKEQHLIHHAEDIMSLISTGEIDEAEGAACSYTVDVDDDFSAINPFENSTRVKRAFEEQGTPLIKFPKALGRFWNDQFVQDGFVALMGPEKIGKTFMLMDIALRGVRSGNPVAFFQAGDMTENQQIRRLAIYLSQKSDKPKYCKGLWSPIPDCFLNQTDECDRSDRECDFGILQGVDDRKFITLKMLIDAYKEYPDYKACRNCEAFFGSPWIEWIEPTEPLTWIKAYKNMKRFNKKYPEMMKLSTHPNETLSVSKIKSLLDAWAKSGFIPKIIVIDYADILTSNPEHGRLDWRNQVNKIWQGLRSLSQERHCLIITATQSDAKSYESEIIKKKNFSEDKRKYAHVTAMYGMNQTDEQKKLGILRLNEIVVREDDFLTTNQIWLLQRLQKGRPMLGSFR